MKRQIFIVGTDCNLSAKETAEWINDLMRYLETVKLTSVRMIGQQIPQGTLLAELECGRVSFLSLRKRLKEASGGRVMVWKVPGE